MELGSSSLQGSAVKPMITTSPEASGLSDGIQASRATRKKSDSLFELIPAGDSRYEQVPTKFFDFCKQNGLVGATCDVVGVLKDGKPFASHEFGLVIRDELPVFFIRDYLNKATSHYIDNYNFFCFLSKDRVSRSRIESRCKPDIEYPVFESRGIDHVVTELIEYVNRGIAHHNRIIHRPEVTAG